MSAYLNLANQVRRERVTETRICAMETHEIVAEVHFLEDGIESLKNEINRLRYVMDDVADILEGDTAHYNRNGPQWTSEQGNEYESTSDVLACSNERAAMLREALKGGVST